MEALEDQTDRQAGPFTVFAACERGLLPPVEAEAGDSLRAVLTRAGLDPTDSTAVFLPQDSHLDEREEIDDDEHCGDALDRTLGSLGIGRGARIVCSTCRWVEVEVRYQSESKEHRFRPSATVRRVLRRARNQWNLDGEDFETIKLRICGSREDLDESKRLVELLGPDGCALCMELVPTPKVNG